MNLTTKSQTPKHLNPHFSFLLGYSGQSGTLGMMLREVIWAAAIADPGTRARKKQEGELLLELEDECVGDPSRFPSHSYPKSFEPIEELHSAYCFLTSSEGKTCLHALLLCLQFLIHSFMFLILDK